MGAKISRKTSLEIAGEEEYEKIQRIQRWGGRWWDPTAADGFLRTVFTTFLLCFHFPRTDQNTTQLFPKDTISFIALTFLSGRIVFLPHISSGHLRLYDTHSPHRHSPHQTFTTPCVKYDIHHTRPYIYHTRHSPHQIFITPDIHIAIKTSKRLFRAVCLWVRESVNEAFTFLPQKVKRPPSLFGLRCTRVQHPAMYQLTLIHMISVH